MWKRVIRDYVAAFRWERVNAAAQKGNWWMFIYMLVVLPALWKVFERAEAVAQYYLIMVPLLFGMLVLSLYPAALPKIMYLCPMSGAERRDYLNKSRFLRIMVPVGMSMIGLAGLTIMGNLHWAQGIAVIINQLLFSVFEASIINQNGYGVLDANGKRTVDWGSKAGILEGCMFFLVIITAFIHTSIVWDGSMKWWLAMLLIGIPTALELPIVVWFCKRWPENVERAIFYETAVNIVEQRKV